MASPKYDEIGITYSDFRKPDPRIAAAIHAALGSAQTVLNVGAGTGSYEPTSAHVTALEPSAEMISQRPPTAAPCLQGFAEDLPFADQSFDASMAILTIHHWTDKAKGLAEMRRVTRGPVVLLTFDPAHRGHWIQHYLPELAALDDAQMPQMSDYAEWLGPVEITRVPVPHNCSDGFLYGHWRRPRAYLDPRIRSGSSSFWAMGDVTEQLAALERDLDDGTWDERYGHLIDLEALDCGYRLVTTPSH